MSIKKTNYLSDSSKEVDTQRKDIAKQLQDDRDALIMGFGKDAAKLLEPLMEELAKVGKFNKEEIKEILSNVKVQTNVTTPKAEVEVKIPTIKIPPVDMSGVKWPPIKVPKAEVIVRVPEIKVPNVVMPDEMNIKGWVQLQGIDLNNPLPVQLRDADGKPVSLGGNTIFSGGSGGGKSDYFTIKGYSKSAFAELQNGDGRLKVSVETGGSGLTDNELRASHLDVKQLSGSIDSVYVTSNFGTTFTTDDMINPDNRLRVSVETGGSGLTDAELRASSVPVAQVSGANYSVNVTGVAGTVAASIVDSSGVGYSGSNRFPTRPINVRGSMQTAYVEASSEGEKTLLTGVASTFHDLVYLMGANSSDAAITVDIRQSTGGTVQMTLEIPANGTAGVAVPVPIPQDHADATWTADNNSADASNTIYAITALFSKEL